MERIMQEQHQYLKKNIVLKYILVRIHKVSKINICRMIKCNLLKFSFVLEHRIQSNIFWLCKIRFCNKISQMFSFLPLTNNSVTIGLRFLLLSISAIISSRTINDLRFFLNYIIQYFYKYQPYHLSIQSNFQNH